MFRVVFLTTLVLFAPLYVTAQNAEEIAGTADETGETPVIGAPDFIPVFSLYGAALSGDVFWRPDWPLSVPPDAFSIPGGDVSAFTLTLVHRAASTAKELAVRRNGGGLLAEFPLFKNGALFRVETRFDPQPPFIRGFTVAPEASETAETEDAPPVHDVIDVLIIEYEETFPSLVRVVHGETIYFVMIEYAIAQATEIWYDQDGKALAVFSFQCETPGGRIRHITVTDLVSGEETAEVYHYDSMGNISGIVSSAGEYSALYIGKGKPRYWERSPAVPGASSVPAESPPALQDAAGPPAALPVATDPGHFSFQWDENGRITRFTGVYRGLPLPDAPGNIDGQVPSGGDAMDGDATGGEETDVRYEYILDERGNWIERRATSMTHRAGFLVSGTVERIFRRIEYPVF
jgi:hypothetical protein